jgi:hypothetical protein
MKGFATIAQKALGNAVADSLPNAALCKPEEMRLTMPAALA